MPHCSMYDDEDLAHSLGRYLETFSAPAPAPAPAWHLSRFCPITHRWTGAINGVNTPADCSADREVNRDEDSLNSKAEAVEDTTLPDRKGKPLSNNRISASKITVDASLHFRSQKLPQRMTDSSFIKDAGGTEKLSQITLESNHAYNPRLPSNNRGPSPLPLREVNAEDREVDSCRSSTLIQIGIHDWMKQASDLPPERSFLKNSIDLAWMLTNHLSQIIASSTAATKLEDHINAENIIIYLDRSSSAPPGISQTSSVTDAKFKSFMSVTKDTQSGTPSSYPRPRAVCVALGKLLMEIFSRGRSRSSSLELSSTEGESISTENDGPDETSQPRMRKRQSAVPESSSLSSKAKSLLISLDMPLSICQLVCDLMDAEDTPSSTSAFVSLEDVFDVGDEECSSVALTSVREALMDLSYMKKSPQSFVLDRTCPQKAMDDTCLFDNSDACDLIGRETEISALMFAKDNVSVHIHNKSNSNDSVSSNDNNFLCEATFLSGYPGCGKSSLLRSLVKACNEDQWFVLGCKFEQQSAAHMILAKAFNVFFEKWGTMNNDPSADPNPAMIESFNEVCRNIFSTMDDDGLHQLCALVPSFRKVFPLVNLTSNNNRDQGGISSMDNVGSAKKRIKNLFYVLVKSLCSAGCPVLLTLDDLQWSESFVIECVADFVVNCMVTSSRVSNRKCQSGLLIAGTFRSNEVSESDDLIKQINVMNDSRNAKVTVLSVGELSKDDVTTLISSKLYLPLRYTCRMGEIVHRKTRGNPFFVVQFLKSIIQNKMLSFSVKSRRWTWDCDVIDMQIISEGVAELLTTAFNQLPSTLMQAVKIFSCLGSQVEQSTIVALDSSRNCFLSFKLESELPLAVKEGIMEKAGPVYQFTHDIVHHTIYELIPSHSRKVLHKTIGTNLLKLTANDPTLHLLAMDQINAFCKDDIPNPEECLIFAQGNAVAAKFAIDASSFEQARTYVDLGLKLLDTRHWETQYSLSLDLFEMSASVSCIHGDTAKMSAQLDEILSRARTFDDSLKASSLLVKLLESSSKLEEARSKCSVVLKNLGEDFPQDIELPLVLNELSWMKMMLKHVTSVQIKQLPRMTDSNKLNAMKFLNMLASNCFNSKPMLLPFVSGRMVLLTMEYGFCDDSIVGLTAAGCAVLHFANDVQFASHLGKVSKSLIEESPKKHALRSRLCSELVTLMITEPIASALPLLSESYHSSILTGDVEKAMNCRWLYGAVMYWNGSSDLFTIMNHFVTCAKEATKYRQYTALNFAVANLNACSFLSGRSPEMADIKSFDELEEVGEKTNSTYLLWHTFMNRLSLHFWMRKYKDVLELSRQFSEKHPSSQQNRLLNMVRNLFEGIAYFNLARDTKLAKWKAFGMKCVEYMSRMESMSKWNYSNKVQLLQAELHYAGGDLDSAEAAYEESIKSAHEHKLLHEEALACELYGIFCVENGMADKGSKQLLVAIEKFQQWGAMKKVGELQQFLDTAGLNHFQRLKLG